uniref:BRCT domain-containing protein n=1 Tax=Syphacia muris TaxID=451379 RepID=A0A0N5AF72_9BILA
MLLRSSAESMDSTNLETAVDQPDPKLAKVKSGNSSSTDEVRIPTPPPSPTKEKDQNESVVTESSDTIKESQADTEKIEKDEVVNNHISVAPVTKITRMSDFKKSRIPKLVDITPTGEQAKNLSEKNSKYNETTSTDLGEEQHYYDGTENIGENAELDVPDKAKQENDNVMKTELNDDSAVSLGVESKNITEHVKEEVLPSCVEEGTAKNQEQENGLPFSDLEIRNNEEVVENKSHQSQDIYLGADKATELIKEEPVTQDESMESEHKEESCSDTMANEEVMEKSEKTTLASTLEKTDDIKLNIEAGKSDELEISDHCEDAEGRKTENNFIKPELTETAEKKETNEMVQQDNYSENCCEGSKVVEENESQDEKQDESALVPTETVQGIETSASFRSEEKKNQDESQTGKQPLVNELNQKSAENETEILEALNKNEHESSVSESHNILPQNDANEAVVETLGTEASKQVQENGEEICANISDSTMPISTEKESCSDADLTTKDPVSVKVQMEGDSRNNGTQEVRDLSSTSLEVGDGIMAEAKIKEHLDNSVVKDAGEVEELPVTKKIVNENSKHKCEGDEHAIMDSMSVKGRIYVIDNAIERTISTNSILVDSPTSQSVHQEETEVHERNDDEKPNTEKSHSPQIKPLEECCQEELCSKQIVNELEKRDYPSPVTDSEKNSVTENRDELVVGEVKNSTKDNDAVAVTNIEPSIESPSEQSTTNVCEQSDANNPKSSEGLRDTVVNDKQKSSAEELKATQDVGQGEADEASSFLVFNSCESFHCILLIFDIF